jgi:outer membrane protein assembly factor BamB
MKPVATFARALAALLFPLLVVAGAAAPDPIEGKWFGQVGFPQDRVDIGLEFRRNATGDLKAYLYQPVINFYGLELPGVVQAHGASYELKEYGYSIKLSGETLDGTFSSLNAPLTLKRVDSMPAEVPVPDLPSGPEPLWQTKLAAPIYATAALRDGMAYVGTTGGVFHAVRVKDGGVAWTFSAGRPMFGEAAVTSDAVYFVCDNGYLFKLNRVTGKELWRYDLGDARVDRVLPHPSVYEWDFKAPRPVVADGTVYVGSGDGSFHAVRESTGRQLWRFMPPAAKSKVSVGGTDLEQKGKVRADAAIDGQRVVFGSFDGNVYALDRATGKQVWKKNTGARVDSTPVVMGDKLIVGNYGGLLAGLNKSDGAVAWRLIWWGSAVESTPVAYGDLAYMGASDLRRVTCFDPKQGRVLWRTDVYGWPWGRPAVTDTMVYMGVAGGSPYDMRHVPSLTALYRSSGAIAWRRPVAESGFTYGFVASPAVEGNTLVIGALDGTLYAFPAGPLPAP